jgi:hypothetical protein
MFNCSNAVIERTLDQIYQQFLPILEGMASDYVWAQTECGPVTNQLETLFSSGLGLGAGLDPNYRVLYTCLNARCTTEQAVQLCTAASQQSTGLGDLLTEISGVAANCPGAPDIAEWTNAAALTMNNVIGGLIQNIEFCD